MSWLSVFNRLGFEQAIETIANRRVDDDGFCHEVSFPYRVPIAMKLNLPSTKLVPPLGGSLAKTMTLPPLAETSSAMAIRPGLKTFSYSTDAVPAGGVAIGVLNLIK